MAIKSFENLKTNDLGETDVLVCPVCGKATAMRLFENVDKSSLARLLKKSSDGIAVCPKCASVFDINENYVQQKKSGTVCKADAGDLTLLVKGNG